MMFKKFTEVAWNKRLALFLCTAAVLLGCSFGCSSIDSRNKTNSQDNSNLNNNRDVDLVINELCQKQLELLQLQKKNDAANTSQRFSELQNWAGEFYAQAYCSGGPLKAAITQDTTLPDGTKMDNGTLLQFYLGRLSTETGQQADYIGAIWALRNIHNKLLSERDRTPFTPEQFPFGVADSTQNGVEAILL